ARAISASLDGVGEPADQPAFVHVAVAKLDRCLAELGGPLAAIGAHAGEEVAGAFGRCFSAHSALLHCLLVWPGLPARSAWIRPCGTAPRRRQRAEAVIVFSGS